MIPNPNVYIAVIDDDEAFCRSLARLLRAVEYQPITYPSAEMFLADRNHPRFDCLLLDIALGGISGLELGRRLAAGGFRTPIIYITAHDDPKSREEALAAHCFAFVSKVESKDVLLKAVADAVASPSSSRDSVS